MLRVSGPAERVTEFLASHFHIAFASGPPGLDDKLFSSGAVDSFGVLELIVFLEDTFGLTIDPSQHDLLEFDSVRQIVALVERRREDAR
jgi:acyl carrier protein